MNACESVLVRRCACNPLYQQMDRERSKLKEEGEAAAEKFRAQVSEAEEEVESLREALLQSNAEARRCALVLLLVLTLNRILVATTTHA